MPLTTEEREQFLAEPHVGALAVDAGAGRAPLNVPVWYLYEPGGDVTVLTGRDSRKAQLIRKAGRFSLMVETVTPRVRYVSVEGPVVDTRPGTPDDMRTVTERYLPPPAVEPYLAMAEAEHGPQVVVTLRPERWLSADLGPG